MKKAITILTVILSLMLLLTACGTKAAVAPSGALLLAETVLKGRTQPAARILQEENKTEGQEPLYVDDGTVPGVYRVYSFMGMPLAGFAVVMDTTPEEAANFMVLELREDGTGSIDVQGEHAELTYTVNGDSLTMDVDGEALTVQMKNGLIYLDFDGNAVTLARLTEAAYTAGITVQGTEEEYLNDGTVAGTYWVYSIMGMKLEDAAKAMNSTPAKVAGLLKFQLMEDGSAVFATENVEAEGSYVIEEETISLDLKGEILSGTYKDGMISIDQDGTSFVMARLTEEKLASLGIGTEREEYINDGTIAGEYLLYSFMEMSLFEYAELAQMEPREAAKLIQITLTEDGVARVVSNGEVLEMPYTLEGESIAIGEGRDLVDGTLKDGLLTLSQDGMSMVLARLTENAYVKAETSEKGEAQVWTGVYYKMVGSSNTFTDDPFSLELYADGTGVHHRDGFHLNITWTQEGDAFSMTELLGGATYTGTMTESELHLFNGDPQNSFTFEYVYSR